MWINSFASSCPCLLLGVTRLSANRASGCGRLTECWVSVNKASLQPLVIVWLSSKMGVIRSAELIRFQKEEFPTSLLSSVSPFSGCLQRRAPIMSSERIMHTQPLVLITTSSFATEWDAMLWSTLRSQWQTMQYLRCSVLLLLLECRPRTASTYCIYIVYIYIALYYRISCWYCTS